MRTHVLSLVVDPNDPLLEPVHGVGFETYADLSHRLLSAGVTGSDAIDAIDGAIGAEGLDATTWPTVQAIWVERMHRSVELAEIYSATEADESLRNRGLRS